MDSNPKWCQSIDLKAFLDVFLACDRNSFYGANFYPEVNTKTRQET